MPSWPWVSTDLVNYNVAHVVGWSSTALGPWDPGTQGNGMSHTKTPPQGHVAYILPPVASNPAWPFVLGGPVLRPPYRHD